MALEIVSDERQALERCIRDARKYLDVFEQQIPGSPISMIQAWYVRALTGLLLLTDAEIGDGIALAMQKYGEQIRGL